MNNGAKMLPKTFRKSINFLIDFRRQNGGPEASKMEPKLGQGLPKKPPKNKSEKELEKRAKLAPKGALRLLPAGMREAPPDL